MGLISAGEIKSNAVKKGIDYLLHKKNGMKIYIQPLDSLKYFI